MTIAPGLPRWATPRVLAYVAALGPIAIFTVRVLASSWYPEGDAAIIGLKAAGILDGELPLLGQWTTAPALDDGLKPHHPGPIGYYLLAPFLVLSGKAPWGLVVGSAAVVALALSLTVTAAHRIGGDRVAVAVGISQGLTCAILGAQIASPWNPWPTTFMLPAAALLTACLVRGQWWALPWWVLAIAVAAQNHTSGAPVAVALSVIGALGIVRALAPRWPGHARRRRPPGAGLLAASGIVGVLAWLPVVLDMVRHDPSNVEALLAYSGADGLARFGWWAAAEAFSGLLLPSPVDAVLALVLGAGFTDWLLGGRGGPGDLVRLVLMMLRPAALVVVGAGLIIVRHLRAYGPHITPRERGPVVPVAVSTTALLVAAWTLARADQVEDSAWSRAYYALTFAPLLWMLAALVLVVLWPEVRDRWQAWRRAPGRRRPGRGRRRTDRPPYGQIVTVALVLLGSLVSGSVVGGGPLSRDLARMTQEAVAGTDGPVGIVHAGKNAGWQLPVIAYAVVEQDRTYYVEEAMWHDRDTAAHFGTLGPPGTVQVLVVNTDTDEVGPPPDDGWELVGSTRREAVFLEPAGTAAIYRQRTP